MLLVEGVMMQGKAGMALGEGAEGRVWLGKRQGNWRKGRRADNLKHCWVTYGLRSICMAGVYASGMQCTLRAMQWDKHVSFTDELCQHVCFLLQRRIPSALEDLENVTTEI